MDKKRIIVVGAGLAGTAAAYELAKSGKYTVTLLEAEQYLGGRVRTLPVKGHPVDFGGFIIYPWYTQFHRLLDEFDSSDEVEPLAQKDIFYQIEKNGTYLLNSEIPFPKKDTVALLAKSAFKFLQSRNLAEPNLDLFNRQTISEYLHSVLGNKEEKGMHEIFTTVVCEGYCYGPTDKYKTAFIAPIIHQTTIHGNISSAFFFPNGNERMIQMLEAGIKNNDGTIITECQVTGVNGTTLTTTQGEMEADGIVFAQRVTPELYTQILPSVDIECEYTHFYAATVEFDATPQVNNKTDWGGVFYFPEDDAPYQILSSINLQELYTPELEGMVTVNVRVQNDIAGHNHELSQEELYEKIEQNIACIFPDVDCSGIVQMKHWQQTMPIAQEQFVEAVRTHQGKNGYFFAGDYLGGPSMEVALETGVQAAQRVIDSI